MQQQIKTIGNNNKQFYGHHSEVEVCSGWRLRPRRFDFESLINHEDNWVYWAWGMTRCIFFEAFQPDIGLQGVSQV